MIGNKVCDTSRMEARRKGQTGKMQKNHRKVKDHTDTESKRI